ncbi:MAG: acetyl-CoA carboxylase biotin carboxyl carrier protein [Alphaproteobacteria bacterium]|nr:acetyl-CoA carboxylase biotin carboxyl carrier protein [Alphaproteobacteria bacterium]
MTAKTSKPKQFDIDTAAIRKLAKLIEETGLSEIECAHGSSRIRCVGPQPIMTQSLPQQVVMAPQGAAPAVQAPSSADETHKTEALPSGMPVTSPMVGTVYMAPSPDSPPFVKTGDAVKEGDTLLIIEAMKVMNPIKAPRSGRVGVILVEDAKPVEYGETLLIIE